MSSWTEGYVADLGYTHGYYPELNPIRANLSLLKAGFALPTHGTHCELGFGQGVSVNIHAAASGDVWHGTDFNPTQVSFAQELAAASSASVFLVDEAFADFAQNKELPQFDSIGMHGIWSWINDENRAIIIEFIKRKLKVGGILYVSYNTQPGWSDFAPMRNLLAQHAETMGADGHGIVNRIDGALDFAEKLMATNPGYSQANLQVGARLKRMKGQSRQYLAHEYFNRDWQPMFFGDMNAWMTEAKLNFACSAHYADLLDEVNLTKEQQEFLGAISDGVFRQSVRDFMVNQQFRRDYWVKGARTLAATEWSKAVRSQSVVLTRHRPDIPLTLKGSRGEFSVAEANYAPVLDFLADHQTRTLGEIEQAVLDKKMGLPHVLNVVIALISMGSVSVAQDPIKTQKAKASTDKLNAYILGKVTGNSDYRYLASPVTGGGIPIDRVNMLFLAALQLSLRSENEWANFALNALIADGQGVMKNGKPLTTVDENLAELQIIATEFSVKRLPIYKALQIV